jgi:hypothetical protein
MGAGEHGAGVVAEIVRPAPGVLGGEVEAHEVGGADADAGIIDTGAVLRCS